MSVNQLFLSLPHDASQLDEGTVMHNGQWVSLLEDFKAAGGAEVFLGGPEPLAFPGFWYLVKQAQRLKIPSVTAILSGNLLEPQVLRMMVTNSVRLLVRVDSVNAQPHDALNGTGSHGRALAALRLFLELGLTERVGVFSVGTRSTWHELADVAAWAAGESIKRVWWAAMPGGAQGVSPEEKTQLVEAMIYVGQELSERCYVGPLDHAVGTGFEPQLLRVLPNGDAQWGYAGEGGALGNVRRRSLRQLADQTAWMAGA